MCFSATPGKIDQAMLCGALCEINALQHMIEVLTHLSWHDAMLKCLVKE
jgi:hypothetical protein